MYIESSKLISTNQCELQCCKTVKYKWKKLINTFRTSLIILLQIYAISAWVCVVCKNLQFYKPVGNQKEYIIYPYYSNIDLSFRFVPIIYYFSSLRQFRLSLSIEQTLFSSKEKNRSYVRQEVADERRATKEKEIGFQR